MEDSLATLLDNLPGMVYRCLYQPSRTLQFASAAAEDLTGYRPEELCNNHRIAFTELIHPDDREPVAHCLRAAIETGGGYHLTYRISTAGGEEKRVSDEGKVIRSAHAIFLAGYITDITQRRETRDVMLGVAQSVAAPGGDRFFEKLCRDITDALSVCGAIIALLDPAGQHRLRPRACIMQGQPLHRICHDVSGTPCAAVVRGTSLVVASGARARFPDDPVLAEFNLEAYAGTPVRNRKGEVIGLVAVYHDQPLRQTELVLSTLRIFATRTAAEIEHQRTQQRLTLLTFALNRTPEAMYLTDEQARFIDGNAAACRALGYKYQDLLKLRVLDIDPDYPEAVWQAHWRKLRTQGSLTYETLHRRRSGEYFPVEVNASIFEYHGQTYRLALARDITERKRSQIDLAERIKELHCLYRVLELTTVDNRPVEAICADITNVLPASLLHADHAVARIVIRQTEHRSDDWQAPTVALRSSIESDGQTIGFVEIGYRSTHFRECRDDGPFLPEERSLLDSIAMHIRRLIEGRRMQDILSQAQRLESIGQLTGGIAHDFNNLLTVIQGNAELLAEELATDPKLNPLADMINSAARRGGELTHRLLAFARKQALEPEVLVVNQLIRGMEKLLQRTLGEHIEIELLPDSGLWPTLIDPVQLESALLNLALNARDAMPRGGRLVIETSNTELDRDYADRHPDVQPGPYVQVTISDTGTGIAPEHLERVFEPFYTTKEKAKGTGLGLSMVYGFVKQSGGHLKLYSEPGQGTTVRMYLPRVVDPVDSLPEPDVVGHTAGGHETILLVEDDDLVRTYVEGQLQSLGYRVLTAANGPEALAMLHRHQDIALLFTDIVMPGGLNGRELAEAAQRLHPGLRVLYTSGYTENAIIHHGRLDPDAHLLSKPYRRNELASMVREALA